MKKTFKLVATAAAGLEAIVGKEIRQLGIDCQVENGKVLFEGDIETIVRTNLWLRAADRIKIIVGSFKASTFEELFQGVFNLDWDNYLPLGSAFPISKAKCVKSNFTTNLVFRLLRKKRLSKNFKNTTIVQKVFLSWKMVQSTVLKYQF